MLVACGLSMTGCIGAVPEEEIDLDLDLDPAGTLGDEEWSDDGPVGLHRDGLRLGCLHLDGFGRSGRADLQVSPDPSRARPLG